MTGQTPSAAPSQPSTPDEFARWVADALSQLYDSVTLQSHPLGKALFPQETNLVRRCQMLRKTLLDAIHSLEPGAGVPVSAPDRRLYRLIELRYIEGLEPNEAMARLSLAKSQFYRDQARVHELVVEKLRPLLPSTPEPSTAANSPSANPRSLLINAEVERLSPGREAEGIRAEPLASDLRQLIFSLAEERQVAIGDFSLSNLEGAPLDRVLLRQALLSAMVAILDLPALRALELRSSKDSEGYSATVVALPLAGSQPSLGILHEQLEACYLLIEALGGVLQTRESPEGLELSMLWRENRQRRLLVVDDNAGMADLFRVYLKGVRWQVLAATSGREAREALHDNQPDLIMLDILMPQEDGWELLRAFKTDPASANIPVVICSVLKQPQIALKLGATAYVEKPVSQETLLEVVTRLT